MASTYFLSLLQLPVTSEEPGRTVMKFFVVAIFSHLLGVVEREKLRAH
jgi:hypothetical protein